MAANMSSTNGRSRARLAGGLGLATAATVFVGSSSFVGPAASAGRRSLSTGVTTQGRLALVSALLPPAQQPGQPQQQSAQPTAPLALGAAALLSGAYAGLQRKNPSAVRRDQDGEAESAMQRRASAQSTEDVNYFELITKGDLPKRIGIVLVLLALSRIGFYIPLYGFDADAVGEYFGRQASSNLGFVDQLFGGGLGRVSLFSLGIGPYITSSIIFQILTTVNPSLKGLAQGEDGEAGRDQYKNYIKQGTLAFAIVQGFGQASSLQPFVFDNGPVFLAQVTAQFAFGAMCTLFIADTLTEQKLGQGSSLLVFSSIVSNLPRTLATTVAKAGDSETGTIAGAIFALTLIVTIFGLVYILSAERRIPILFAKRLQDEASGQGATDDAGGSYLPIKLNASGVLPLIFAGSLLSLPALAANYTRLPWLQPLAKSLLPGEAGYIPISMVLIAVFSYVSTFQVLDPKDMAKNLRKQAAAVPAVRPGKETEAYLREVLTRSSVFGAVILASLFVLPNVIEALTKLSTPNSFGGTSLLILVGVAADTWRQLQAELLMQQYATDVDKFYKGKRG